MNERKREETEKVKSDVRYATEIAWKFLSSRHSKIMSKNGFF